MQNTRHTLSALTGSLLLAGMLPAFAQEKPRQDDRRRDARVMERRIVVDSVKDNAEASRLARQIVNETYRNYPQNSTQPTIIINNILISPENAKTRAKMQKESDRDDDDRRWNDDDRDDSRRGSDRRGSDRRGNDRRRDDDDRDDNCLLYTSPSPRD